MFKNYVKMLNREFSGYNASKLVKDLLAGLTVTAVSLPLALAFGVQSGADAAAGLITAIVASLVIGALSGASFQISGPTGTMMVVLGTVSASYGLNGIFWVCLMAGLIRVLCGILKLGKLVELIPRPVITGFTSGIALIIILGQIDSFFGTTSSGAGAIDKLLSYGSLGFKPNLWAVLLGVAVIVTMLVWPKSWNARVPSSLVGIAAATAACAAMNAAGLFEGGEWLGQVSTVGSIPSTPILPNRLSLDGVSVGMLVDLLPSSVTVAALCMIETLLCGASAARMKSEPFDADIELVAQGVGNMVIPFFGGVPATAALARTSVAIRSGSQTRLTGIFHALWMLAAMFLLGGVISIIPMSALGGVLIMSAWRMNDWTQIKYIFKKKFVGAIIQFLATMIVTVVFDLTVAIIVGIICAILAFVKHAAHIDVASAKVDENRLAAHGTLGRGHDAGLVVYITGNLFFANINKFTRELAGLPEAKELILSMRGVQNIDITAIEALGELIGELRKKGVGVTVCAMNGDVENVFKKSGVYDELGEGHVFESIDKALIADADAE